MRKKLACTLLVTAMTAVTLAGCGSSNNAAGDPASNDAAKTTESTEESCYRSGKYSRDGSSRW